MTISTTTLPICGASLKNLMLEEEKNHIQVRLTCDIHRFTLSFTLVPILVVNVAKTCTFLNYYYEDVFLEEQCVLGGSQSIMGMAHRLMAFKKERHHFEQAYLKYIKL